MNHLDLLRKGPDGISPAARAQAAAFKEFQSSRANGNDEADALADAVDAALSAAVEKL